jgi:GDP-mannose pyrophosphatase NudK
MASIQITEQQTLSDNKYPLKLFTYQLPDENDKLIEKKTEVYYRPDAASVLLYDTERKKFLLTRQFRLPTYLNGNDTGILTEACAGLIDEGETPEQTAIREVYEETGYEITDLEKTSSVYTSAGGITEYIHMYIAPYSPEMKIGKGGGLAEEGEDVRIFELDMEEARTMLRDRKIIDAKTVMLLQYYFLFHYLTAQ